MAGRGAFSEARIESCYDALNDAQLLCVQRFIVWYHPYVGIGNKDILVALERLEMRIPPAR